MNLTPTIVSFLKLFTSSATNWLLPIILSAVTWVFSVTLVNAPFLAESLASVDKEKLAAWLTGAIVATVLGLINGWTNSKLKEGTAQVQDTLNQVLKLPDVPNAPLNTSGVAGTKTNDAAKVVVDMLLGLIKKKDGGK
jgi:hypothetical protein